MEILLARHGATAGNLLHRHLGVTDEPLCPEGRAALQPVDEALETVFVSPLLRARETAAVLFPGAAQIPVPDLAEMHFGRFENKNYEELSDDPAYRAWVDGWCEGPCPGGESRAAFCSRTCAAFAALVSEALERGDRQLAIVAHGGTVMAVGERFAVPRRGYFDWKVPNGAVCRFTTSRELWQARQILTDSEASICKSC